MPPRPLKPLSKSRRDAMVRRLRRPRAPTPQPVRACQTVFILQCLFPDASPVQDSHGKVREGHWTTCYAWVYACGMERVTTGITAGTRRRLEKLMKDCVPGEQRLAHRESLAYARHEDARDAVVMIRKWESCRYKVRIVRDTIWKEQLVVSDTGEQDLPEPFAK
jgi:hypothetical protein